MPSLEKHTGKGSGQSVEVETYVELMVQLRDLANKWMRDCESVEAVIEKLVVEQFMDGLPPQLRVWMTERGLTSMEEVGLSTDYYVGA